jgi:hypothetical protein
MAHHDAVNKGEETISSTYGVSPTYGDQPNGKFMPGPVGFRVAQPNLRLAQPTA